MGTSRRPDPPRRCRSPQQPLPAPCSPKWRPAGPSTASTVPAPRRGWRSPWAARRGPGRWAPGPGPGGSCRGWLSAGRAGGEPGLPPHPAALGGMRASEGSPLSSPLFLFHPLFQQQSLQRKYSLQICLPACAPSCMSALRLLCVIAELSYYGVTFHFFLSFLAWFIISYGQT